MSRRGFALATAVVLIPLAAVAVEAVNELLRADVVRTNDTIAEAQLTQLLLAGCIAARTSHPVVLPRMLSDEGGAVAVTHEGDHVVVRVQSLNRSRQVAIDSAK